MLYYYIIYIIIYYINLCYVIFYVSYFIKMIKTCVNRAPKSTQNEPKMAAKSSQNGAQTVSKKQPSKGPRLRKQKHCKTAAGSSKSAIRRSRNRATTRRVFHVSHDYKQLDRNDNGR